MITVLVFALSVIATVSAQGGTPSDNPGGSVTCFETGYNPVFTYTPSNTNDAITNVDVGITIGSPQGVDDAVCTKAVTNLVKGNVNEIRLFGSLTYADMDTNCGQGELVNSPGNADKIQYKTTAVFTVTETIRNIKRESKYSVEIECSLTRETGPKKADFKWKVDRANLAITPKDEVTGGIDFPIDINFYTDANYNVEVSDETAENAAENQFTVTMGNLLYIRIEETGPSDVFKFVTNKCYFNFDTTNNGQTNADVFFDSQCPIDKDSNNNDFTEKGNQLTDSNFDMQVKAFFFTGQESSAVHLYCELFICLTADTAQNCQQASRSDCSMEKRRRRRDASGGPIETRIVESKQVLLLDKNDVIVPSCGEGFVYDRVTKSCGNKNLMDIIGVYLDIPWDDDYANKSSLAYKNLAIEKAYQLYALIQMSEAKNHIVGLEVVDARKGSVILTVRVNYSAMSNADAAFEGFVRAIESVDQSRVANILNIRKEKVIEFVEVRPASTGSDQIQYLTVIIIVVVVLFVAILVSIAAVWRVKMARGVGNSDSQVKAYDNPTMVTVN